MVRALNEYRSIADIENTILKSQNGSHIRLGEVAKVTRVPADPEVIARIGGKPCVLIDVQKQADANIIDICRQVRERVFGTDLQQRQVASGLHLEPLPKELDKDPVARQAKLREREAMKDYLAFGMRTQGIEPVLLLDQSRFVRDAVDEVLANAWQGGLLSVFVLYLFLRSYFTTLVLALSIPASLIATFAPMFIGGIDLNIMSLGGLALGVGMLLDNSIVVLESITKLRERRRSRHRRDRRHAPHGKRGVCQHADAGGSVFPIVFVEGIAGQLFSDLALTVVYAQLISIPVALFLVPMLAALGGNMREPTTATTNEPPLVLQNPVLRFVSAIITSVLWFLQRTLRFFGRCIHLLMAPLASMFLRVYRLVELAYPPILRTAIANPGKVILAVLLLLSLSLWRGRTLGQEILPEVHQGEFYVEAFLPRSATVRATDAVMRAIEQQVTLLPDVSRTFLAAGVDPEELNDSEAGKHSARIQVVLTETHHRAAQEQRVRAAISRIVMKEPAVQSHRFATASILQFQADLVIEVIGHDLTNLRLGCEQVVQALQAVPQLGFVRATLQRGNPELTIKLDRDKLAALSLQAEATSRILRTKVLGDIPTMFVERERKIDMRVRVDRSEMDSEERLRAVNINPKGIPEIPLSSVAEILRREGPSEIRRLGNVRGAEVHAQLRGFDLSSTQLRAEAAIAELHLPLGITARIGSQKQELERSNKSLLLALALAVFLVYIVMAAQFESVLQPLIIMISVPLALIGVVFVLDVSNTDLSVIVFLGCIVLAGIVVNNAIILIDQINQLRSEGIPFDKAVMEGSISRLRPVMMTMLTTLVGLLPQTGWLASLPFFGGSADGIELRAPMAITVIAGLISSTLLTLVLVPLVYSLVVRKNR